MEAGAGDSGSRRAAGHLVAVFERVPAVAVDRQPTGRRLAAALPAPGGSARRYVSRKATIAVLEHRKRDGTGLREWESFGISERSYYKLLKRFAPKIGSRYDIDEGVRDRIRAYLAQRASGTKQREAAMEVLQERGFAKEAARKWLQRHPVEKVLEAHP